MFRLFNILFILLQQNAFTVEKYLTCIITKYTLSYVFRLKVAIFREIHKEKEKVKQSHYMHGQAQRVPGG